MNFYPRQRVHTLGETKLSPDSAWQMEAEANKNRLRYAEHLAAMDSDAYTAEMFRPVDGNVHYREYCPLPARTRLPETMGTLAQAGIATVGFLYLFGTLGVVVVDSVRELRAEGEETIIGAFGHVLDTLYGSWHQTLPFNIGEVLPPSPDSTTVTLLILMVLPLVYLMVVLGGSKVVGVGVREMFDKVLVHRAKVGVTDGRAAADIDPDAPPAVSAQGRVPGAMMNPAPTVGTRAYRENMIRAAVTGRWPDDDRTITNPDHGDDTIEDTQDGNGVGVHTLTGDHLYSLPPRSSKDGVTVHPGNPDTTPTPQQTRRKIQARYDAVAADYAKVETDPEVLLESPAIRDVTVETTAAFHTAMSTARDTLDAGHTTDECVAAVDALEQAWTTAMDTALNIGLGGLSTAEKRRAERLWTTATAVSGVTDAERRAARDRVVEYLDQVLVTTSDGETSHRNGAGVVNHHAGNVALTTPVRLALTEAGEQL